MGRPRNNQEDVDLNVIEQEENTANEIVVKDAEEVKPSDQKMYTSEEVDRMMNEKFAALEEKLLKNQPQAQPVQVVEKVVQQNPNPFTKGVNSDDLPELRNWEVRERTYVALTNSKAISMSLRAKHKAKSPLQYFNKEKGTQHALRYASNESSFFIENQTNNAIASHILMTDGYLQVPGHEVNLQKFLAIHPDNGIVFKELDERAEAKKRTEELDFHFSVQKQVREINFTKQKAIARLVCKSYSDSWSPERTIDELRYEANQNPLGVSVYLSDPDVEVKAVGKSAVAKGLILYDSHKFMNDRKEHLVTVPIGTNEWDVFASWAKSAAGRNLYEFLEAQF
jgi:hypothetical protein